MQLSFRVFSGKIWPLLLESVAKIPKIRCKKNKKRTLAKVKFNFHLVLLSILSCQYIDNIVEASTKCCIEFILFSRNAHISHIFNQFSATREKAVQGRQRSSRPSQSIRKISITRGALVYLVVLCMWCISMMYAQRMPKFFHVFKDRGCASMFYLLVWFLCLGLVYCSLSFFKICC